jgi:hypothetical protein
VKAINLLMVLSLSVFKKIDDVGPKIIVLLTSLIIVACETTPGISEPSIYICTVLDDKTAECVHSIQTDTKHDISTLDLIGYQCVSPNAFATLKLHHEVLHDRANKKINRLRYR